MEKPQKKVQSHVLASFFSDPLYGSKRFSCFLEGFATLSVQQCQLLIFLWFLFLFLGFLGESFTLTSIHWHSFHSSTFYIGVFIELLWLLSHQRKCTVKTALSPTSLGTPLDWCLIGMPRFWFLTFKDLARVLQTWNHWKWYLTKTIFFKNGLFKQHFVVQKNMFVSKCLLLRKGNIVSLKTRFL